MAGSNNNNNNGRNGNAAASALGSPEPRVRQERRRRWVGCFSGLSCFGSQKGGKRVAPASRIPEGNTSNNRGNGGQPNGLHNQASSINPSLLAPPSSPASFTNSALPSTAQSPTCFLSMSAQSPGGPSNVYATGPYANETQLVSPPVFSTFTTEPSTAPFTPPPELNHLTTPSSPDVPFALTFSSAGGSGKSRYVTTNDLQSTYPLYPESPASSLISPISGDGLSSSFPEREFPARWGASISAQDSYLRSSSSRLFGGLDSKNFMLSQDSSFFYPPTSAQFYLDQAHSGGRPSVSREAKNKASDVEELEAYRASFGFSADEIVSTTQYVEISDEILDGSSFTMAPLAASTSLDPPETVNRGGNAQTTPNTLNECKEESSAKQSRNVSDEEDDIFSKMGNGKINKRYQFGLSSSDCEIDYRRGKSLRERKGDYSWGD